MTTIGKNQIMIFGPQTDGTYVVEFKTVAGEALAISIPASTPQARIFPAERRFSKAVTTRERSVTPFGQCSK